MTNKKLNISHTPTNPSPEQIGQLIEFGEMRSHAETHDEWLDVAKEAARLQQELGLIEAAQQQSDIDVLKATEPRLDSTQNSENIQPRPNALSRESLKQTTSKLSPNERDSHMKNLTPKRLSATEKSKFEQVIKAVHAEVVVDDVLASMTGDEVLFERTDGSKGHLKINGVETASSHDDIYKGTDTKLRVEIDGKEAVIPVDAKNSLKTAMMHNGEGRATGDTQTVTGTHEQIGIKIHGRTDEAVLVIATTQTRKDGGTEYIWDDQAVDCIVGGLRTKIWIPSFKSPINGRLDEMKSAIRKGLAEIVEINGLNSQSSAADKTAALL